MEDGDFQFSTLDFRLELSARGGKHGKIGGELFGQEDAI
jgi:hypothetical protein